MAIIALVSTLLGIFGGAVPKILDEVRDTRNHTRELELIKMQADVQLQLAQQAGDNRLREMEAASISEQFKAMAGNLTEIIKTEATRTTGIAWIDAANATLRPICAFSVMTLFMLVAAKFSWGVLNHMQNATSVAEMAQMANIVFASMVGESFMAVMGFVFGYRSLVKK